MIVAFIIGMLVGGVLLSVGWGAITCGMKDDAWRAGYRAGVSSVVNSLYSGDCELIRRGVKVLPCRPWPDPPGPTNDSEAA